MTPMSSLKHTSARPAARAVTSVNRAGLGRQLSDWATRRPLVGISSSGRRERGDCIVAADFVGSG